MMNAPVVLFVYNRVDHFQKTIVALSKCTGADKTDLFIFSDGSKKGGDVRQVQLVRDYAHKIEKQCIFSKVVITESIENKGLARSIIHGVSNVINKYGRVIVLEDDCIVSPYFLLYMNKALEYFCNDIDVGSISGYCPDFALPENYKEDIFAAYRSCSWSWATWSDRWQGVDWDLKEIADFYKNPELIKRLNANGNDRFVRLYRQTKGNGNSWSVRFGAHLVKNNMITIYPRYSYTQNIGCDESGVHSKAKDEKKMKVDLSKSISNPRLVTVKINDNIQKRMKRFYSGGVLVDIKRALITSFILLQEHVKQ